MNSRIWKRQISSIICLSLVLSLFSAWLLPTEHAKATSGSILDPNQNYVWKELGSLEGGTQGDQSIGSDVYDGVPYIAYLQQEGMDKFLNVYQFVNSDWEIIGNNSNFSTERDINYVALVVKDGIPIVAYAPPSGVLKVKQYNKTSQEWEQLGSDLLSNAAYMKLKLGPDGQIYLVYNYGMEVYVKRFNGLDWVNVNASGPAIHDGAAPSLTFKGSGPDAVPYVIYHVMSNNSGKTGQMGIRYLENNVWKDDTSLEKTTGYEPSLIFYENQPVINYINDELNSIADGTNFGENLSAGWYFGTKIYSVGNELYLPVNNSIYKKNVDSNSWVKVNTFGNSAVAYKDGFHVDNNTLYISMIENGKVVFKKLEKDSSSQDEFAGGDGSEATPYQITNAEQLNNVRKHLDKNFILVNDIDLNVAPYNAEEGWEPLGSSEDAFKGKFNGNGKKISNLYIEKAKPNLGLFGYTESATIQDVNLENVNVVGLDNNASNYKARVGSLVGRASDTEITHVSSSGEVRGVNYVGGLVGTLEGRSRIIESSSSVNVTISHEMGGGLVGQVAGGGEIKPEIKRSFATGNVFGEVTGENEINGRMLGGFIGELVYAEISDCYALGSIKGGGQLGGFVGNVYNSSINNAYSVGELEGSFPLDNPSERQVNAFGPKEEGSTYSEVYYNKDAISFEQQDGDMGTGLKTKDLKDRTKYPLAWDFAKIWEIREGVNDGYPHLRWLTSSGPVQPIEAPGFNPAPIAGPGSQAESTSLTGVVGGEESHFVVQVSSNTITAPNIGDDAPKGTGVTTPYTPGSDITGVDAITNKYVGVYEVDKAGKVVKFNLITLTEQDIKHSPGSPVEAPALDAKPVAVPGELSNTTTLTAAVGDASHHLVIKIATKLIATPNVGDTAPTMDLGVLNPYTSGEEITGLDYYSGAYLGVYEVDSLDKVVKFSLVKLPSSGNSVTPDHADFDKKPESAGNTEVKVTLASRDSLVRIANQDTEMVLVAGNDYSVNEDRVKIKKSYLNTLPVGITWLKFTFSSGQPQQLKITVTDSSVNNSGNNNGNNNGNNSSGESSNSTSNTLPTPVTPNTGADILVNGKVEKAGTAATSKRGEQIVTTIAVDQKKLDDKLAAEGQGVVVTIPLTSSSDVVIGELNGQMIKNMEDKLAVLKLQTDRATYTLPAKQININAISSQFGQSVALKDIKLQIEMAVPTADMVKVVENAAAKGTFSLMVPPVNFTVQAVYNGKTIEVSKFNAYVERLVAIPDGVDPNKITTGVVVDPDGTVRHVPTKVTQINGKFYAVINSLTNSTYSVVWHPLEFSDVASHWAKKAVNDMGSRMVIEGMGDGKFNPDQNITRAEFAAIVVRGLGLKPEKGATPFSDVKSADWYSSAVETAYAYQLINGFEDGTFRPNDQITREQAMVIIAKAMRITQLKAKLPAQTADAALRPYTDAVKASGWAYEGIADSLKAGIIKGRSDVLLAPQAFITRAEVAAIMERLLQKSDLI
ncbi:hypothetical protein J2Z69_002439 [Paenibacillus shirakamiensis]|uniref:SLH domain-containing protein n=1 Tax=Paenibacillus shirakamiensis TaxID=1265935 RepID=A0ABS4JI47_9BACL|nr:S-layer homology domain-containing protein [Paenibacillus shirakamiensis]MBP2001396.1 hypothetical protein [Paenibacillus shirakamiensis]